MSLALLALITGLRSAWCLLMSRKVRRSLDATGGALIGFGARLATEHV